MIANYVDFISASPKDLHMAGFVLVLFVLIMIKIAYADKRNKSCMTGYLEK